MEMPHARSVVVELANRSASALQQMVKADRRCLVDYVMLAVPHGTH